MKLLDNGLYSVSVSGFMDFIKSPYHYHYFHILGKKKYSDSMTLGQGLHAAVFEPEKFKNDFYTEMSVPPELTVLKTVDDYKAFLTESGIEFKKSSGKDALRKLVQELLEKIQYPNVIFYEDLQKIYLDKTQLTPLMMEKILEMQASVVQHNYYKIVAQGSHEEYVGGEIFGMHFRGRVDSYKIIGDTLFITDLKTTVCADNWPFAKSIASLKYHVQGWLYRELLRQKYPDKKIVYTYLAVESAMPFITESWAASTAQMDAAREFVRANAVRFGNCVATNHWPAYTDGRTHEIELPKYAEDEAAALMMSYPEEETIGN